MLMAVRKNIDLLVAYFQLNLQAAMAYKTSFLLQVFGMFLNNSAFAFFWWLLFAKVGDIKGYGFSEVMLLWSLASSGFGLCFIVFGNARRLAEMVVKGELDSYLLQPKNLFFNILGSKTVVSAWGDLFYGVILFALISGLNPRKWLLYIIFTITCSILYLSSLVAVHSLSFFFGNISALADLFFEFLITLSIYPSTMFEGIVKGILFSVIPAGFATMIPVTVIQSFDMKFFGIILIVTAIWFWLAYIIFNQGVKHYESGNLMIQKL